MQIIFPTECNACFSAIFIISLMRISLLLFITHMKTQVAVYIWIILGLVCLVQRRNWNKESVINVNTLFLWPTHTVQREVFSGIEPFYISLLSLLQSLENIREQSQMAYAVLSVLLPVTNHCNRLYQHQGFIGTCGSHDQLSERSLTCFATCTFSKLESCPRGLLCLNIT